MDLTAILCSAFADRRERPERRADGLRRIAEAHYFSALLDWLAPPVLLLPPGSPNRVWYCNPAARLLAGLFREVDQQLKAAMNKTATRTQAGSKNMVTNALLPLAILLTVFAGATLAAPSACVAEAKAAPDGQDVLEGVLVTMNASPSKPNPATYLWSQVSGPAIVLSSATALKPTFVAPNVGPGGATVTLSLRVTGCSPTQSNTVTTVVNVGDIAPLNYPPSASATVSPASALEGTTVTLSSTSTDPDGDTLSFSWLQTGGPSVTLADVSSSIATFVAPNTAYPNGSSLTFRLTVSDGILTAFTDKIANIVWVDDPPTAALTCPASVNEGQTITLNGTTSSDPDDGIASYGWSQTLGPPNIDLSGFSAASISFTAPVLGPQNVGAVPFKLTVTDFGGQKSSAECTVFIHDVTAPTISGTGNISAEATSALGATVTFAPTADDNVDGSSLAICAPGSGSTFALGDTPVDCTADDSAGNVGNASFTVTVTDTTGPAIAAHGDESAEATGSDGASVSYDSPATSDLVDGAGTAACTPASGGSFALGDTLVTCTASDTRGNPAANRTFNVNVADHTAPVVTPPGDVTVEASGPQTAVNHGSATATDAVGVVTLVNDAPATFPVGSTTITWTATDAANNSSEAFSTVTVVDTTPPTVDDNPDPLDTEATSSAGAVAEFDSPSASDLVDGTLSSTCSPLSGWTFPIASTTVTCSATDAHGNTGTSSFTVHVVDTTPPVIATHGNIGSVEATSSAGAPVGYSSPATSDAVDGAGTASCSPASGSTFPLGDSLVLCSAVDGHSNIAIPLTFHVTVIDSTAPVIAGHANLTAEATGPLGASVAYTSPLAADAVDGSHSASCTPASGSLFAVGNSTATCTAADAAGNVATPTSFNVTVVDTTAPTITAHADVTAIATSGSGAIVSYVLPSATDIVDGSIAVHCLPASGTSFAVGTTTVNCSATDNHGNGASSSFTVTVSFNFTGFFKPIDNLPVVNVVKAGSAVPVKFSLGGNMGLAVMAAGYPKSAPMTCQGGVQDLVDETVTAGGSSLSYDATTGQYIYVWKSDKSWAGTCGQLQVKFADGSVRVANFNFNR